MSIATEPHGHASHDPHLAHHFDTPEQQFSTGKLGMWTFLATEVLMFGGLFCAYAVYRHNNPDVFLWSHKALDTNLGAINTAILLASSFTMAWGVRAAQLNQKRLLLLMLALTFLGGVGFMGIKAVEYKAKWEKHLFPGKFNVFNVRDFKPATSGAESPDQKAIELKAKAVTYVESHGSPAAAGSHGETGHEGVAPNAHAAEPAVIAIETPADPNAGRSDEAKIKPPTFVPAGIKLDHIVAQAGHASLTYNELPSLDQKRLNTFFSIYFCMTGLHAIHVLIGMGIIAWLFFRALGGAFSSKYFTPVDIGGLYWHLVDLIWIFLFPLLYLIH